MKPSRFNIVFEKQRDIFLFNALRGSFLRLKGIQREQVYSLGSPDAQSPITKEPEKISWPLPGIGLETLDALVQSGYVIEDNIDELQLLRVTNRLTRFSSEVLNLTILTTLDCNFQCVYCYEDKNKRIMSSEVQDRIERFVSRQFPNIRSIGVTWFGGEPLLGVRIIEKLSLAFQRLCQEHGASYQADMITNGYLLNRSLAKKLALWGVKSVQITLDGIATVHDLRRPLKGGEGTFKRIFENICKVYDILAIVIRMNLDPSNARPAKDLVSYLADQNMQDKLQLSFAPVHNEGKGCRDRASGCKDVCLFNLKEFTCLQAELYSFAYECGFPFYNVPQSKGNACSADLVNSYVIEPNGTLQKCWQTVTDPAEKIGDVFAGTALSKNLLKWLDYDPFSIDKCRKCRVLPLCMGWCPIKIMADSSPESCNYVRHTIIKDLLLYHENALAARAYEASKMQSTIS